MHDPYAPPATEPLAFETKQSGSNFKGFAISQFTWLAFGPVGTTWLLDALPGYVRIPHWAVRGLLVTAFLIPVAAWAVLFHIKGQQLTVRGVVIGAVVALIVGLAMFVLPRMAG